MTQDSVISISVSHGLISTVYNKYFLSHESVFLTLNFVWPIPCCHHTQFINHIHTNCTLHQFHEIHSFNQFFGLQCDIQYTFWINIFRRCYVYTPVDKWLLWLIRFGESDLKSIAMTNRLFSWDVTLKLAELVFCFMWHFSLQSEISCNWEEKKNQKSVEKLQILWILANFELIKIRFVDSFWSIPRIVSLNCNQ